MRISSGTARGRVIKAPKGVELRPTEERVRQALFNILGPSLNGSDFLDLCSGSGAVGLESLSRGAKKAVFIDREARCLKNTEEHALAFGFEVGSWETFRADAARGLESLAKSGKSFDFIYLDPPYEDASGLEALHQLGGLAILKLLPHARLIYEHARKTEAPAEAGALLLLRQYPYGNTLLSFYTAAHAD